MSFKDFAKAKYPLPHSSKIRPFNILTDLKPGMKIIHKDKYRTLPGIFVRYDTITNRKVIFIRTELHGFPTWSNPEYIFLNKD